MLADAQALTERLRCCADLIVGAALASSGRQTFWLTAARAAHDAATENADEAAREQAREWLVTDQPDGGFERAPVHWPLVFPEVFDEDRPFGAGFDAIIGNPPFLGGQKLTGALGTAYREYLVRWIGHGVRGSADLIAYFLLRAHGLLNRHGQADLIATNTLAQGDTREVGLDQIAATGTEIRQSVKSEPWPSKSAVLEYAAVWLSRQPLGASAERLADGTAVSRIAPSLDPASRVSGKPQRLAANAGISFQGSIILGLGFAMESERAREMIARDPRNKDVVFPYLNGQDLNSRPDCSASRWVINFHDWPEDKAKTFPELYAQVFRHVKPERDTNNRKIYRDYWWQYAEKRPAILETIIGLDQVIVITLVSKVVMPIMAPTGQVFSHMLGVFATDDRGMLTLLVSAPHYWWTIGRASTLETRIRYTSSDVFETLPLPEITGEMRETGRRLDTFRRELMLARQAGLTATYNLVHDERCADAHIAELREIHRAIDEAVVRSYDWNDLLAAGLGHGFHEPRQGPRYTIGPGARREILDRLLELNQERYATEVAAGLHDRRGKKRPASSASEDGALF